MSKKVLVLGGSGLVGSRFVEQYKNHFNLLAPSHHELDCLKTDSLQRFIEDSQPDAILNCVAFANTDTAELEKGDTQGLSYQLNVSLVESLAKIAKERRIFFLQVSTDFVFDGQGDRPYVEEDTPNPINWYGETKYLGEKAVRGISSKFAIARIQMPYRARYIREDGSEGKKDFARFFYGNLIRETPVKVVTDQVISPVFTDDAVKAFKVLIEREAQGIFHIASTNPITPLGFVQELARQMRVAEDLVEGIDLEELYRGKAPRPRYTALNTRKFEMFEEGVLHSTTESIRLFLEQV